MAWRKSIGAYQTVYSYTYNSAGSIHSVVDHINDETTVYKYNTAGQLIYSYVADNAEGVNLVGVAMDYDDQSRLQQAFYTYDYRLGTTVGSSHLSYVYQYQHNGNLQSLYVSDSATLRMDVFPTYDGYGRTSYVETVAKIEGFSAFYSKYAYDYKTNGNQESGLVSQVMTNVGLSSGNNTAKTYGYTYDDNGNITAITQGSVIYYQYQYDDLGQLIREDNREKNKSYVYTYDDAGNITAIKTYDFTTGTLGTLRNTQSFTYQSSGWRDLLLHVGYDYISYDAIGNPTMIYDNYVSGDDYPENGAMLSWQGRELTKYEVIESYGVLEVYSYTYNADGIRTSKTISGIKHEYLLNGSQIVRETWTENGIEHMLVYLYDEKGAPIGLRYRTSTYEEDVYLHYFFEKNLQGDIIAIFDENGNKIGTYTYDAWGNCTVNSLTGFAINNAVLNTYNPFRYRGYYYDVETGFYYLQSRYYNPAWGRFINPDRYDVIGATPMGLTDKNLFAYCDNNPVMRTDEDGEFWETAFDLLSLGFSIADVVANPINIWSWAGLVGDTIDLIPFVTGVGEVTRAVNIGRKALKTFDNIGDTVDNAVDTAKAIDNTIDTYKNLRKINKGTGKEVHHIVEKRFAKTLQLNEGDMLSVALDPTTHRKFTKAWREKLSYGKPRSIDEIWEASQNIYRDYPDLLEAAKKTIWR